MVDIASLGASSQEQPTKVEIRHPATGLPFGLVLHVVGYESERVRKVERRIANAAMKQQRRKLTYDEARDNTLSIAAATVTAWDWPEGFELSGNSAPACTPDNVKELLRQCPFVGEQMDAVAGDRASFLET